ncbi:hypothetical protein CYMTET_55700 [Cymbomonas tetramitiformis]|uniref:protein-serine/threonine phosphatase n=1 Tax=Cymbomonas tetramitiformis TaxID=36881 RepID=A0AAE0EPH8_9CHLO|nr:hypothetical protein CYMTET_55700 [Cymbomonas tetramitiformis]
MVLRAVGVAEHANPKHRARMEDRHVVQNPLPGSFYESAFLGVFDGHGGREAADFAAETLHKNLMTELQFGSPDFAEDALERAYLTTDSQMKYAVPASCGTTAVTALVTRKKSTDGPRVLYIANVGDARGVLCRDLMNSPVAERMSIDHKPADQAERSRIEQAGGAVINQRVLGVLAVSRALGDHELKSLVSGKPQIQTAEIPGGSGGVLILACDGIFDVMSDQEAVDLLVSKSKEFQAEIEAKHDTSKQKTLGTGGKNAEQHLATFLARALVSEAMRRCTRDNVTALVALL